MIQHQFPNWKYLAIFACWLIFIPDGRCDSRVIIRDNEIYLVEDGGSERQITRTRHEKHHATLEPTKQRLLVYHTGVERDSIPATELVVIDMERGSAVRRVSLKQKCRSIHTIDWLSDNLIGLKTWNRGRSFRYVIVDLRLRKIVQRFWVDQYSLSHDRRMIAFSKGLPGGYIPNPDFSTLRVAVAAIPSLAIAASRPETNEAERIIYAPTDGLAENGVYELESAILWSRDDAYLAFVCSQTERKWLVVTPIDKSVRKKAVEIPLTELGEDVL